jgi:hypothetical protein
MATGPLRLASPTEVRELYARRIRMRLQAAEAGLAQALDGNLILALQIGR